MIRIWINRMLEHFGFPRFLTVPQVVEVLEYGDARQREKIADLQRSLEKAEAGERRFAKEMRNAATAFEGQAAWIGDDKEADGGRAFDRHHTYLTCAKWLRDRLAALSAPDEGERCQCCGEPYELVWWCHDELLWEKVTGNPKPVGSREAAGGLMCITCFDRKAREVCDWIEWAPLNLRHLQTKGEEQISAGLRHSAAQRTTGPMTDLH